MNQFPDPNDTRCCVAGKFTGDTTSGAWVCNVDERSCEVTGLVELSLARVLEGGEPSHSVEDVLETVNGNLPCSRCRSLERHVSRLPRLGKHERRILLAAPPSDADEGVIVPPLSPGRSADEANRRAIRKLLDHGLLWIGEKDVREKGRRPSRKRCVWLSPLGQAVVEKLRPTLKNGGRIRWDTIRPEILQLRETPAALLARMLKDVEGRRERQVTTTRMLGALARTTEGKEWFYRELKIVGHLEKFIKAAKEVTQ